MATVVQSAPIAPSGDDRFFIRGVIVIALTIGRIARRRSAAARLRSARAGSVPAARIEPESTG
jgi:hypothetical protein